MTMRMRRRLFSFFLAGLILSFSARDSTGRDPAAARLSGQEGLRGRVTAVYDGDTVKVRLTSGEETRVRLIGVDAPETADEREKVRMMAFLAKRFAYLRLYGKDVRLTPGPELRDAFGRLLAFIRTDDGVTFNETLVREGYAFAYFRFPFDAGLTKALKDAEAEARQNGRGLWAREPWPLVTPGEAGRWEGRIATVRFICARAYDRGRFRILESGEQNFQAVIPSDVLAVFPGSLSFRGRTIVVTGIIERYRGVPQIMVGLPAQIDVHGIPLESIN
jgi:micrococcal nuclease